MRLAWAALITMFVAPACGSPRRVNQATLLPGDYRSGDYPKLAELATVEVSDSEWQKITSAPHASPCDRRAKYVASDRLALVHEAFRSAPYRGLDVDCDRESASFTVDSQKHEVDAVRARVGTDANGKLVRFNALSTRTGYFVEGLLHTRTRASGDGVVVVSIQRYLPEQLGAVYFWQDQEKNEVFITAHGASSPHGIYLVAPVEPEEFRVGIAKFRVAR